MQGCQWYFVFKALKIYMSFDLEQLVIAYLGL